MSDVDPEALLALALGAATAAADLLLESRGRARATATATTKTSDTDMVSDVDRASEALIQEHLLAARRDDGFLGEECGEVPGTSGVRWVVDPLDGTTNYLYGHTGFNVSIAAEYGGQTLAGVVIDPLAGDTFTASLGGGARRNGTPIRCSGKSDPATSLCATGFAYDPARRAAQAAVLSRMIHRVRDIRRVGAAAIDLCSVACGRVDAYWERGLGPWDLAAGMLIAGEAGAVVEDGRELGFCLAAPPGLFGPLAQLLVAAGAPEA